MKKIIIVFIMLSLVAVFGSSQEEELDWSGLRRTSITFDPATLILGPASGGIGFAPGFEHAFKPQFAIKAQLYFMTIDPKSMFYDVESNDLVFILRGSMEARWYPMENNVHGLFAAGGLQFQNTTGTFYVIHEDYDDVEEKWVETGRTKFTGDNALGIYIGLGYKFIIGKRRYGLVIEPALNYIWSVHLNGDPTIPDTYILWPPGTQGFRFTIHLGLAF